jgi:hypothetical protein
MRISELLKENELNGPQVKQPASNLPSAASIDDAPEELEFDGEIDGEEVGDDDKQAAIDAFKAAGVELGEGLWAVTLFPNGGQRSKELAIGNLIEAFPEFNDNVLKSAYEQLFVAVFNEDSMEFESIRATPHENDRTTSEQFNELSKLQNRIIGDLYSTISKWSADPDKHNTHKLKSLLG